MKISGPVKLNLLFHILVITLVASSCVTYQQTPYYSDGIYGDYNAAYGQNNVQQHVTVSDNNQSYEDYFAYKSQQYAATSDQQGEVFTDIDSYSGASVDNNVDIVADYGYGNYEYGNNYSGWGGNVTNVYINAVPNYNWGWSNWGWNSWYGNGYYANTWYNSGWYDPYWGYNSVWRPTWGSEQNEAYNLSWGWNSFYGPPWGYGWNSWAGGYGFYCPSTSNYGNSYNNYAVNNSRRGNYSNRSGNYPVSENNYTRSSRRSYEYSNYPVINNQGRSKRKTSGVNIKNASRNYSTKRSKNYSTKRNNPVKSNTSVKRNNSSKRNNNSSYNRSSSQRKPSTNTYRSSTPSRSSGNSVRSSSNRSSGGAVRSRSSGGSKRSGRT